MKYNIFENVKKVTKYVLSTGVFVYENK